MQRWCVLKGLKDRILSKYKLSTTGFMLGFLGVLLAAPTAASAALSISNAGNNVYTRPATPEGLSGITYAGGDQYYTVEDSDGLLWPVQIGISRNTGAITSSVFGNSATLTGGRDLEGVAYNPANNSVFVSDETGATIKEYALTGGQPLSVVDVPLNLLAYRNNFSLEALSIRGDGLELWTSNEEALYKESMGIDDGPISSKTVGTVVRLTRFNRPNVHAAWEFSGQWAYQCDPYPQDTYNGNERSGVADLCILPDGTLLVLERAFSMGYLFGFPISPDFRHRIYEVNFSGATEVSDIRSLNGATYTKTVKSKLWEKSFSTDNFEGICLGPRLNDDSLSLLLVSDGDGSATESLFALKLSGLNVWELTVESPQRAVTPLGTPYRYVDGSTVESWALQSLVGESPTYNCTGWSLTGPNPDTGSGTNCSFQLTGDSTLTWLWTEFSPYDVPITDSFERYNVGALLDRDILGWSGTGSVISASYNVATPPGYPMPQEAHTQVLQVEGFAQRTINAELNSPVNIDFMLQFSPTGGTLEGAQEDAQLLMLTDSNNYLHVWHYAKDAANNWVKRWSQIWPDPLSAESWYRVSVAFDYHSSVSGDTFFCPRLNGSLCPSEFGFKAPDDLRSPGPWYLCTDSPGRGGSGKRQLSEVIVYGDGKLDDFVATYDDLPHTGSLTTNGVAFTWFDKWGIARNPYLDVDGDGIENWQEYFAGTDPTDGENFFRVIDIWVENGHVYIQFLGNDSGAATPYVMLRSPDLTTDNWEIIDDNIPRVAAPNVINTWSEPLSEDGTSYFYRIKVLN